MKKKRESLGEEREMREREMRDRKREKRKFGRFHCLKRRL